MRRMPHIQTRIRTETTTDFIVRQTFCLVTFGIHFSLLGTTNSPSFIALALSTICIIPTLVRFTPNLKNNANRNLLLDTCLHSLFLGFWGFNPYLCAIYAASINVINVLSGGITFGLKGLVLLVVSAIAGGAISGFYLREEIPFLTYAIASAGLLLFLSILGVKIYRINFRLRNTRTSLEQQTEELTRLNHLATVINSHLNVDIIMKSVMNLIEEVYPFEAMYVLSFQQQDQSLQVLGIYGSSLTESQHSRFRNLSFNTEKDHDSMFIQGLLRKKVIYLPTLTAQFVDQGSETDRQLFAIKPSRSIAYFPIFINDTVIGGACFINYETSFTLSKTDITTIQKYLIQVGTAVRNTTQFEELTKAKELALHAQSKAEASEEAKSRFLANMSHEIRTPLTAIMGYSEALQEESITHDDQVKFVGHIVRSSQHLLTMINDILDISKIEADKVEFEKIDSDILEILLDIESYMSIKTKEKDLSFEININYPIPQVIISDPTRLKQILLNLCNNAVKFTEKGGIVINIESPDLKQLKITIIDTGIGISTENQEKIFKAFDQADTSTTRLFGGTGLGLCISKNLAQLLGGDITVDSQLSLGSTFTFTLPLLFGINTESSYIQNENQYFKCMEQIKKSKTYEGIPQLSGTILVAEDNPENQDLIVRLIRQTGMNVDIVENGQLATEAAKDKNYSLILLDMQMPIMGGKEAAHIIRAYGIQTPIVAFTANVMKHQVDEYKRLGFSDVLEKPIVKEKLFSTIKTMTRKVPNQKQHNVLIAEDNEVNQLILSRYVKITNENAVIHIANNGQEAIDKIIEQDFDLILMDMEMPIMNGIDATIKTRELGFKTPIYIVTGNIDKNYVQQCLAAGANGHLQKPLEKAKVVAVIESALK